MQTAENFHDITTDEIFASLIGIFDDATLDAYDDDDEDLLDDDDFLVDGSDDDFDEEDEDLDGMGDPYWLERYTNRPQGVSLYGR